MKLLSRVTLLLGAILVARFLGFAARTSIVPFFPEFMTQYGIGYTQMGILVSAFLAGYAVSLFPCGLLADRFDGRRLIAVGLLVLAITFPATVLAPSWFLAAVARFLMGAGSALLFSPALKLIVLYLPQRILGLALSLQEITIALGMLFALVGGPLLAPWLPYTTLHMMLGAVCAVIGVGFLCLRLPPLQQVRHQARRPPLRQLFNRDLILVGVVFSLTNAVVSGYLNWLPAFVQNALNWGRDGAALVSFVLLAADAALALVAGRLTDQPHQRSRLVAATATGIALACATMALFNARLPILAASAVLGVAIPMAFVPLQTIIADAAGPERVGAALGLFNAGNQISGALAGSLLGWLIDVSGSFRIIWWVCLGLMVLQIPLILNMRAGGTATPAAAQGSEDHDERIVQGSATGRD